MLGSMTLTLYDVPPDVSGSIVDRRGAGQPRLGPAPGQNATLRFDGTAGQRVSLRLSNVTIGNVVVLWNAGSRSRSRMGRT